MKKIAKLTLVFIFIIISSLSSINYVEATSGACSWHGGVNCAMGRQPNGMVYCNDSGWQSSMVPYEYMVMCQTAKVPTMRCDDISYKCKHTEDFEVNRDVALKTINEAIADFKTIKTDNKSFLDMLYMMKGSLSVNVVDYLCHCQRADSAIDIYGLKKEVPKQGNNIAPVEIDAKAKPIVITSIDFPTNSTEAYIKNEKSLISSIDYRLSKNLSGRVLLQVEKNGQAWYVNTKDNKRYYMANGEMAYSVMRKLGTGISNQDLYSILGNSKLSMKNIGRIFIQVESHGEAWYIDSRGNPYYLKDGDDAYGILKNLGLGISNSDIRKIDIGEIK